jgi:predicted nucleic acid-binding protein
MAPVLVDTTVLIDVLRGRPGPVDRLRRLRAGGDTPYVCAINVEEVTRGLRAGEDDAARTLLEGFRVVPLTTSEGRVAGAWHRSFAQRGHTLSQADCLVAAAAAAIGARLATGNPRDFPMSELAVEEWPVGG